MTALANLCQLFAATVGEDDVKLFKYHVQYDKPERKKRWKGTVVEIYVPAAHQFQMESSAIWIKGASWEEPRRRTQSQRIKLQA